MDYCFKKSVEYSFDEAITRATDILQNHQFGVLTTIDVQSKMKEKLGIDFRRYTILGACNPSYAYQALQQEIWIGVMLPCNVVILETNAGKVEVAAVDPLASMQAIDNPNLADIARKVQSELKAVIAEI